MNTTTTIHPQVASFLALLESADAVNLESPLLTSWDVSEPNGADSNQVAHFQWTDDDGLVFSVTLSEEGIAKGQWAGNSFFCEDADGEEVQLTLYRLVPIAPQASS